MFNLTTYNCKGLQQKGKRLKIFNYLKDKLKNDGIFFLQESHSTPLIEDIWQTQWDGDLLFSHGESNARGVIIGFTKDFECKIENISHDSDGRVLLVEMSKNNELFLLINFYNANSECEQLKALQSLDDLLSKRDLDKEFKPILMGDMNVIFYIQLDALGGNPTLKKNRWPF